MKLKLGGACALIAAAGCFAMQSFEKMPEGMYAATSPDGQNKIVLDTAGDVITFSVLRGGVPVVAVSEINMTLADGKVLGKAPKVTDTKRTRLNETVKSPFYKKAEVAIKGEQRTITFEGGYALTLAAFDDGVAYRWETALPGEITIIGEQASIKPAGDLEGFFSYGNGAWEGDPAQNSWETTYEGCPVSKLDPKQLVMMPFYLKASNCVVAMSETDLVDYPGLNFFRSKTHPQNLDSFFAAFPDLKKIENDQRQLRIRGRLNYLAKTQGTRTFPWRTFTLAANPAQLMNADLNYKLATPCVLEDISWIKPGKVAWDWWNAWNLTDVDFKAGCNTKTYENYIDFAAKNGIEYVILDEGWSVKLKIMELNPEVDLVHLLKYAEERNVGLILWAAWPQLYNRQEEIISHYAKMGAKGFKIDFFDRDDQEVLQYMETTAKVAAKYKVLVDYHGIFKPAGMQRTYPNVINFEGVYGLEQAKWDAKQDFMRHDTILPFTRMVAGPLDYTPGAMHNQTKAEFKPNFDDPTAQGTRVHQMALLVLFEAPLQMLCDSPSKYRANQTCATFMAGIPTVWDETIGIDGEPGKFVVIARRLGKTWYIAAVNNWTAMDYDLNLAAILKKGKWQAEIFADAADAGTKPMNYTTESKEVSGSQLLNIKLVPGGGWVAKFTEK